MALKRLAILLNTSWNVYNFRKNLLKSLEDDGFEVYVIAPYDKYSTKLKELGFNYIDIKMNRKGVNPFEDIMLICSIYKKLKAIRPDILLTYTIKPNIYGNIVAKILNIPTISNVSGLGTLFISKSIPTYIAKFMYKYSLMFSKRVFFQNSDDLELFVNGKLVKKEIVDIVKGSGIDTDYFKPIKREKDGVFRFLFIGRMLKDKGLIEYIEAANILKSRYKNVELCCVGAIDVDNKTAISIDVIKEYEKKNIIKYLGVTDDIRINISNCDCVVLPSYREGLPKALLEACSMSKPIVATNTQGCKDIVKDGFNGFLCSVKDSDDLALKMEYVLNLDAFEIDILGGNGRKMVEKEFNDGVILTKYRNFIKNIEI